MYRGLSVAVKAQVLDGYDDGDDPSEKYVLGEVDTLRRADHRSLIKYYGAAFRIGADAEGKESAGDDVGSGSSGDRGTGSALPPTSEPTESLPSSPEATSAAGPSGDKTAKQRWKLLRNTIRAANMQSGQASGEAEATQDYLSH